MSTAAVSWSLSRKLTGPLTPETRLVLVALAEYAGPDGRHAFPSAATIADELGVSERTVRRHLAYLQELGLIRRGDQQHVEHYPINRRPVVYDLDLEGGRGILTTQAVDPDTGELATVRGDSADTPTPPARGDSADTPPESWGVSTRPSGVSAVTPKPRTKPTTTPLPPAGVDPQVAAARAANGYTPAGIHRTCGTSHPAGLSCPPLVPMPADWRSQTQPRSTDDAVASSWPRCPACGGPTITDDHPCRRCAAASVHTPTLLEEMTECPAQAPPPSAGPPSPTG